ncbi:MAG: gliding motility-associated C-terminal domain-containing protein [Bacteroidetes bacterium]|nr:gliding motility-associated C-terminal domain-containing protein [Bacteroidota bacterium]
MIKALRLLTVYFLLIISCYAVKAQTILPPDLQCVTNDNNGVDITLNWTNPPANGCGAFVQYTIFASSTGPAGPYNAIAVTGQATNSFTLTGYQTLSNNWWFYMEAQYNCPGATVLQSDTVKNGNPAAPQIVNVDVTAGGVVFNWLPSTSPQTQGYIIYYYLPNGNGLAFDTVYGYNTTTYTDIQGDPNTTSLVYTVSAFDSCWKESLFSDLPHNTILANVTSTACENEVNVTWNRYHNFADNVLEYRILSSINGGPFQVVGVADSTTFNYAYSGFNDGDSLCIIVRAVSAADTNVVSNSNQVCLKASIVQAPKFNFIINATVDLDNHINMTWMNDSLAELIFYRIDRSVNNVSFDPATQIPAPSPVNTFESFIDSDRVNTLPQKNSYYYQVTTFDSCQNQYVSPYVRTILLKGELFDYYVAHLDWNGFELEHATVLRQNLYRDMGNGYQLIQTFNDGVTEYSDSLQQFLSERGIFCYRIESVYDLNLPNGFRDTLSSFSNVQCIIHRPIIYIPNAFAPNGLNTVFKPTIIYGEPKGYSMIIFNRWGGKVFESTDPNTGWDGDDHGKPAPQGGYGYLIQFSANDGVKVERKGMVLLVR